MAKEIIIERRPSTGITNITQAQKNIVLDPSMSDVARETTSQQILTAVGNIDFSTLAKETTLTNMATSLDRLGDMVLATAEEQAEALADLTSNL